MMLRPSFHTPALSYMSPKPSCRCLECHMKLHHSAYGPARALHTVQYSSNTLDLYCGNAMHNRDNAVWLPTIHHCVQAPCLVMQAVQQQLTQQASMHSAEITQVKSELHEAKSALASAQASASQLQVNTSLQVCDCSLLLPALSVSHLLSLCYLFPTFLVSISAAAQQQRFYGIKQCLQSTCCCTGGVKQLAKGNDGCQSGQA